MKILDFSAFKDRQSFGFFLEYLISESPNIIQIIGAPTIFAVITRTGGLASYLIALLLSTVLVLYLTQKFDRSATELMEHSISLSTFNKTNIRSLRQKINAYLLLLAAIIFFIFQWIIQLQKR